MKRSNRQKGVLGIVALLLVASGGVRFATGLGPAIAYAEEHGMQADPVHEDGAAQPIEIEPVLAALQERERKVAQRETAIEDRMHALSVAEAQLAERLAELEAAETSLLEAITVSESANETDIGRLTAVYENMKPADAAGLFEEMAPEFASGFLIRMRPESAAAIMAGLEPTTAYSISAIIAGRNANAPVE